MKERIDHNNYEAWLLDRLEGSLSPAQEQELDAFLAAHPELDPDMDELPTLAQLGGGLSQAEKDGLKRALPPTGPPTLEDVDDHLVARSEGDLNAEQLAVLQQFLQFHPELQRSARLHELVKLVPEAMVFAHKHELERQLPPTGLPGAHLLDDFLVAEMEGDLTAEQHQALTAYVATHPEAAQARALMQRTRIPMGSAVYAEKGALKRGGRVIPLGTWAVRFAAAASVAVLLGTGIWFLGRPQPQVPPLAEVHTPATGTTKTPEAASPAKGTEGSIAPGNTPSRTSAAGSIVPENGHSTTGERERPRIPREQGPGPLPQRSVGTDLLAADQRSPHAVPQVDGSWLPTDVPYVEADSPGATPVASTLGGVLASVLRERLLAQPAGNTAPLGRNDAVAAMDLGMKAVGGDAAGVSVEEQGRRRLFQLRLGRHLSISAGTDH